MHRFYIPSLDLSADTVTIADPRVLHQCAKVLRMKMGDEFGVFDENAQEFKLRVLEVNHRKMVAQVMEPIPRHTESAVRVSLYQAIPKKTALFEWVVEKATELGVAEIFPLITERTEKRRMSKFERLERIAIESAEQCNRLRVPVIHHPVSLDTALEQVKNAYMAYEYADGMDLVDYGAGLSAGGALQLFIGPEGGFSQREVTAAQKAGVKIYSLGPRILRTETAAISSLALLLHSIR